ncbi:hypothetical protein HRH25_02515 [Flavisolibacter sp. BT320]|nr:hypothetical protein [Flavisolibacter longurius]
MIVSRTAQKQAAKKEKQKPRPYRGFCRKKKSGWNRHRTGRPDGHLPIGKGQLAIDKQYVRATIYAPFSCATGAVGLTVKRYRFA